jgi:hypothetical protein
MFSRFYTSYSGSPGSGVYTAPNHSTELNTPLNLVMILLPFIIAIGASLYRAHTHQERQHLIESGDIQHQREILERIWQMSKSK